MQKGSLLETKRRNGQSVWEFRWRDRSSGKTVYRRIVAGTTQQLASEDEAREIVEGIVLEINSGDPLLLTGVLTMSQLIEHYRQRELSAMRKQIHPAIERLGINKKIGWHTFRHSYSTRLRHLGTDIKVQQDLLRHSSARLTLDTYTQAVTPQSERRAPF